MSVKKKLDLVLDETPNSKILNDSIIQIRSKDSQVETQLVLWIFILFKVTR